MSTDSSTKTFACRVRGYGEAFYRSLTVEASSMSAAYQLARTIEYMPDFQLCTPKNFRKALVEVIS